MKYIKLYLLVILVFAFSSCKEDLEIWDSETLEYSGKFDYQLLSEDLQDVYVDYGSQLMIYNTASNVANEVWIDDEENAFPLKSKFTFTGNSLSFKSSTEDFAALTNNIYSVDNDLPTPAPTAVGQSVTEERGYVRAVILEGKILPKQATTIGGNTADSLYLKIKLLSGEVTYISYEVPLALRQDPEKEEFKWKYSTATYDSSLDEVYVISGHRYTGFDEDHY